MMMTRRWKLIGAWATALCFVVALIGCTTGHRLGAYADTGDRLRNPQQAHALHTKATEALADEPDRAEQLLRRALDADLYHGPAHNNLGVLLLRRGDLYEAAQEFQWARKLMPGHPSPRVNLALTLEKAGKTNEAIGAYDAALAVYEGFLPALQGKARLQIASGRTDADTIATLEAIAFRSDAHWRDWAQEWLIRLQRAP